MNAAILLKMKELKINIQFIIKQTIIRLKSLPFVRYKISRNKIIVDSFYGGGYGDNPGAIVDELIDRHVPVEIVWVVNDLHFKFPKEVRLVKYGSKQALCEYATARIWIDNARGSIRPPKRRGQLYLQTWHGLCFGKRIEADAEENLNWRYCYLAKLDGKQTDAIISNSKLMDDIYRRAFWLNKNTKILKFGYPRYDYTFKNSKDSIKASEIKTKLGFIDKSKIVLYAPTFRDDLSTDGYIQGFEKILKAFQRLARSKVKLIVRMHPVAINHSHYIEFDEDIVNGSDGSSFQELSIISDYLITDYSSTSFDFLLQHKPVFICTPDIEKYGSTRGLLPEFYKYPFVYTKTVEELVSAISMFDQKKYECGVKSFLEENPIYDDGNASSRTVDWILSKMDLKS